MTEDERLWWLKYHAFMLRDNVSSMLYYWKESCFWGKHYPETAASYQKSYDSANRSRAYHQAQIIRLITGKQ